MLINGKEYEIKPRADLSSANLYGANLRGADLRGANLRGANLSSANLYSADLYGADLRGADLRGANLRGANLSSANLYSADLYGADLYGAKTEGCDLSMFVIVPESGTFIGWKKCYGGVLVKLMIPAKARRSNGTERKCRAEYVRVLEVIGAEVGLSMQDCGSTKYKKGRVVRADKFDDDRWNTCSNGIHFFITRREAENYGG